MDPHAQRITDLVVEVCSTLEALPFGAAEARRLQQLRIELCALVADACEGEACDAACGAIDLIDTALAQPEAVRLSA